MKFCFEIVELRSYCHHNQYIIKRRPAPFSEMDKSLVFKQRVEYGRRSISSLDKTVHDAISFI
ncbi:hypothetical protein BLOT_006532 [Blomia tropicalis]|nr:hypothetical protein BLOT_006532 [Blomia tropicalis]